MTKKQCLERGIALDRVIILPILDQAGGVGGGVPGGVPGGVEEHPSVEEVRRE